MAVVRVLGPVQYVDGDREISLPSSSMRRLLAILAVSRPGPVRGERLADMLDVSSSALRTSVSRLRSRLGEHTIRSDATGYRLDRPVDAELFADLVGGAVAGGALARIEQALSLWHGPAYEEFRHESWAAAEAARLDEMRLVAIEDRVELLIAQARCGEAVASLDGHIASHPLRDRARGLLMEALAGDGRQAEALRAYQEYRAYLAEECGTEPSAHVTSIERRVAAGTRDVTGGSRASASPTDRDAPRPAVEIPLASAMERGVPMVGRALQLALLEAELEAVREGGLRVVRLSGDAGIGKTTLLSAFARRCHPSQATVLYGRCDETSVPLQPLRTVVRSLVDHVPLQLLCEHVEVHGGELARTAPHLRARTWAPAPFDGNGEIERFQLFEAVADLLRRVAADRPVVLVLDDVHWAEPTALSLLRHLAHALVDAPVLVVVSARGSRDRLPSDVRTALADFDRVTTRRIDLEGLDDSELVALTDSVLGTDAPADAAAIEALQEQTAGNPLYASQLLLHVRDRGAPGIPPVRQSPSSLPVDAVPPGLADILWRRVHELGAPVTRTLQACSVLAPKVSRRALTALLPDDDHDVEASIDVAVASGLLHETGHPDLSLRFTHALVAAAVYGEIPGAERRTLHRRALAALTETATVELGSNEAMELAVHAVGAADHAAAQHWATRAGGLALADLAPAEAARWYRTALDHAVAAGVSDPERARVEVRLGAAQLRAGDPAARATLLAAAERALSSGANDVLVEAVLAHDRGMMRIGSIDEDLLAMVEAALRVADAADDGATLARLVALHALHLVHTPRSAERLRSAHGALDLIERSDDPLLLPQLISSLHFALSGPGTLDLRRDLALRAAAAADRSNDPHLRFWTGRVAHFIGVESADPAMAAVHLQRMDEIATSIPEPRLRWVATTALAFTAMMEGRLDHADVLIDRSLDLGTQVGDPDAMSVYAAQLFVCRSFAGRYDELLPLLEAANAATPGVRAFELAHAITLVATGRTEAPRALLRAAATSDFSDVPLDYLWMTSIIGYAVLAVELEDAGAAKPLFELLEPFGGQVAFTGATSQGFIGAYLGKLASVLGRHDVADRYLVRSLDVARSFGWRYHEATTLVALGLSRWRRTGSLDDEAADWLRSAVDIGIECHLPIVVSKAEAVAALSPRPVG